MDIPDVPSMYYSPEGVPISLEEWQYYWSNDPKGLKRRVARTTIISSADPKKAYDVSTIFLGLDHSFGFGGPPLIYETMVFGDGDMDLDCKRYSTKEEANKGHIEIVTIVAATMDDPVVMDVE